MSKELDNTFVNWTNTPPFKIALTRPEGMTDEDVADWRQIRKGLDKALINAEKYQDLNGIFTDLLGHYEVQTYYRDSGYDNSDTKHRTKLVITPIKDSPALGIEEDCGFVTFTDCLAFAGQCFLAGQEGFGIPKDGKIIETDIDVWLRRDEPWHLFRGYLRLYKDEEGRIVSEAQRPFDNLPILKVIGGDFATNLLEFNSHILDEEVLRIEDPRSTLNKDGNTSFAPVLINL